MTEWFADESFWRDWYPWMFPEDQFDAATDQVDQLLALTGVTHGDALDLCCGPGRHSIELAKEYLARVFHPTTSQVDEHGNLFVQRHEIVDGWELTGRLNEAGFGEVAVFGALDGRPYDNDVQRLVAVATKN